MSENGSKQRLRSIGSRVKLAREKMDLTQEQFADKYGYARTTLAKLEAGHRDFKSTEIVTLAEQLGVSCDYLLGRTADRSGAVIAVDEIPKSAVGKLLRRKLREGQYTPLADSGSPA